MDYFTVRHNSVLPIIYDVYVIRLHAKLNNRIKYEFFQKLEGEETHEKKYQQQMNTNSNIPQTHGYIEIERQAEGERRKWTK